MAILAMDTVGFLQSVNRLERRFGELTSPEAMREACAHPERRDPLDHRLFVLPMTYTVAAAGPPPSARPHRL